MFIEIILALTLGILCGIVSGLIPGIHVNLISIFLLSISPWLLQFTEPLGISVIILSMAITHSFLDTIPSVFLGAPEAETALSVLPGHKLMLKGNAREAIILTIIGSLGSLIFSISLLPLIFVVIEGIYNLLQNYIGIILIIISAFMILRDNNRTWALILFLLSGTLGLVVFTLPVEESLFPLFSGLFGVSMLLTSLNDNVSIPPQIESEIESKDKVKAIPVAVMVGWVASFMPGLGPAQAAVIGSQFVKLTDKGFLILVGGLSTVNMVLSIVTLFVLEKARNGAVVSISKIITPTFHEILTFYSVVLIVGGLATLLALKLSKIFSSLISKVNYTILCVGVITLILILVLFITKWLGLVILIVSVAIGLIPSVKNVSRSHMMGCLLIPVILYFV